MILKGKRALVTGGTKGIGAAIAIDLARQGCDVAVNGRHDDASAAAVRQAIEATGRKCISIIADVAKPDEVDRLVARPRPASGIGYSRAFGRRALAWAHRRVFAGAMESDI